MKLIKQENSYILANNDFKIIIKAINEILLELELKNNIKEYSVSLTDDGHVKLFVSYFPKCYSELNNDFDNIVNNITLKKLCGN